MTRCPLDHVVYVGIKLEHGVKSDFQYFWLLFRGNGGIVDGYSGVCLELFLPWSEEEILDFFGAMERLFVVAQLRMGFKDSVSWAATTSPVRLVSGACSALVTSSAYDVII